MIHRGDLSHRERVTNLLFLREKVPSGSRVLGGTRTNSGPCRVENRPNRAEFLGTGAIAPGESGSHGLDRGDRTGAGTLCESLTPTARRTAAIARED